MHFPRLDASLRRQLEVVQPTTDGATVYRPCVVTLQSGKTRDCVYVMEAESYIRAWGVWPDDDPAKSSVAVDQVASLAESPRRLPAELANKLYAWGESGMGYTMFTVVLRDGRRLPRVTGNAVDFPVLPEGVTSDDILDVERGAPGGYFRNRAPRPEEGVADYAWCLYSDP